MEHKSDPWTHRHRPKDASEVIGQAAAAQTLRTHIAKHRRGAKAILLAGPPGIGKTTLAYAIAAELDLEIIEVNASDARGKDAMNATVGQAAFQMSLFGRGRLILIDEVDGISGTSDRGGMPALIDVIERSAHPIILTANDLTLDKLKPLKKACVVLELVPPTAADIAALITRVAHAQSVLLEQEAAMGIARRSGGDLRAAINDLQSLAHGVSVSRDALDLLDARDTTVDLGDALLRVLRTSSADIALPAFDGVGEEPDTLLQWMDENLARAYTTPAEIARAYGALSDADRYLGRIRRWQHYRFYVYIYNLLTAGVALAKDAKGTVTFTPQRPERFLKMWIAKQRHMKRDALAVTLSPHLHKSQKSLRKDTMPYLRYMGEKRGKAWVKTVVARYGLDPEQASWIGG